MPHKKGRIAASWELLCTCWTFLGNNKDLIVLPIISLVTNAVLIFLFVTGGIYSSHFHHMTQQSIAMIALLSFACYFSIAFVTLFINSALIACASSRFQGIPMSVTSGLVNASQHIPQLLGWCLTTSIVGLLINLLESSHNKIAELIAFILGSSWSLCSYFVLPILILENKGPLEALKKSRDTFKRNWRRVISINLIFALVFFCIILLCCGFHQLFSYVAPPSGLYLAFIGLLAFLFFSTIGSTLGVISNSALYLYLFQKARVPAFNENLLNRIMVQRKRRCR